MNFFWDNVFEYFKDRRFAPVFFGALLGLVVALIAGAILYKTICVYELQHYMVYALPGVGLTFVALIGREIARARARARDRYKSSPLSRDEMRKARSK